MGRITRTQFGCAEVTVLTNAQILLLPTTQPTIVPAISGKIIQPYLVAFVLSPWVADYVLDGAANLSVNTPTPTYAAVVNNPKVVLVAGQAAVEWCDVGREFDFLYFTRAVGYNFADLVGQPLQLITTNGAAGNFTGGGAGAVLTIHTFFNVL